MMSTDIRKATKILSESITSNNPLASELAEAIVSPRARKFLLNSQLEGVDIQSAILSTPLQGFPTEGLTLWTAYR
jgi:hypothetical protein